MVIGVSKLAYMGRAMERMGDDSNRALLKSLGAKKKPICEF